MAEQDGPAHEGTAAAALSRSAAAALWKPPSSPLDRLCERPGDQRTSLHGPPQSP